jgi:hypothetical protein
MSSPRPLVQQKKPLCTTFLVAMPPQSQSLLTQTTGQCLSAHLDIGSITAYVGLAYYRVRVGLTLRAAYGKCIRNVRRLSRMKNNDETESLLPGIAP